MLAESGKANVSSDLVSVNADGSQAPSDTANVMSPETYLGYERAQNFVSPNGAVPDAHSVYSAGAPRLNEWGLSGEWTIHNEHAILEKQGGSIVYRFRARDLHLVLGPAPDGQPVRFQVTVDGAAPGASHGTDVDSNGMGVVTSQRLYQLIRQEGAITEHNFEIRFLDPGAHAYAFTFG